MNEEYLWDKSGEPDPEIQQLEEILGTLRYQPRPFELPETVPPVKKNHRLTIVAIAATFLIALLAAGLWLIFSRRPAQDLNAAIPLPTPSPIASQTPPPAEEREEQAVIQNPRPVEVAHNMRKAKRITAPTLTTEEREQANEVKQQLMVALKVASEKLNLAQRKTHGPSPNQIRNQHKVG
jgi:hypothetical protein